MTIQKRKDLIFHNYGTDVDTLDSNKLRRLAEELDYLAEELEIQEAKVKAMKHDVIHALSEVADKYRDTFNTIYLFDGNISLIDEDDIDFTCEE